MSGALSVKQAIELSEAWHHLESHTVFLAVVDREFFVEGPEERQDREEDVEDAVLRIFLDAEDAWLYCEEQQEYSQESIRMRVRGFTMRELFNLRSAIENNVIADFGATVRADVCTLRDGEPVVVDTLWSSSIHPN